MSEAKVVRCPRGHEMALFSGKAPYPLAGYSAFYKCKCTGCWTSPLCGGLTKTEAEEAAYIAATAKPHAVDASELDGMIAHCDEIIGGMCDTNPCRADHEKLRAALSELKALRANVTPPNLPLTERQMESEFNSMQGDIPIWVLEPLHVVAIVWRYDCVMSARTVTFRVDGITKAKYVCFPEGTLFFKHQPTPADIAAARKVMKGAEE